MSLKNRLEELVAAHPEITEPDGSPLASAVTESRKVLALLAAAKKFYASSPEFDEELVAAITAFEVEAP